MAGRVFTEEEQAIARRALGIPDPALAAPDLDAPIYEPGPPEIDPRLGAFDWDPIVTNPYEELPPPTPEALARAGEAGMMPGAVFPDEPAGGPDAGRWAEDRQRFEDEEKRRREAELGGFRTPYTGSAGAGVSAKSTSWPKLQRVGLPSVEGIREHGQRAAALGEERATALGGIQEQEGEAFGRYRGAVQEGAQAGIEKAAEQAAFRQQSLEDQDAFDRKQADMEAKRQKIMGEKLEEIGRVNEELANAAIDPERFYKNEDGSTNYGKRVLAGIAMGLGAFGTALAGGQNDAMQVIENAINRDVDAQKSTLANKRAGAQAKFSELGALRGILGDERLAESVLRQRKIERAREQLGAISAKYGGREAQAKAAELDAKLELHLLTLKKQDMAISYDFAKSVLAEEGAAERAAFSGGMQRSQIRAAENAKSHQMKLQEFSARVKAGVGKVPPPTLRIVDPNYVPTKDDTKEAQKMAKVYHQAASEVEKLRKWRMEYGAESLDREAVRVGNLMLNRAKSVMRGLDGTGARLEEAELEMMGLEFDVDEVGYVMSALDTLASSIKDKTTEGMKVYGYTLDPGRFKSQMGPATQRR